MQVCCSNKPAGCDHHHHPCHCCCCWLWVAPPRIECTSAHCKKALWHVCIQVKGYLERQWHKILANRVSVQDFVFAKEVRLGTYSPKAAVVPPAAIVAAKAMATDPRAEPRFAERVPYVVVYGEPGKHQFFVQACRSNSRVQAVVYYGKTHFNHCQEFQARLLLSCSLCAFQQPVRLYCKHTSGPMTGRFASSCP